MTKAGFKYTDKKPAYVFVLGGDGTFVRTIKKLYLSETKIIPINTGTIGFYSSFDCSNLPKVDQIIDDSNYVKPDVINVKIGKKTIYAINEIALKALNTISCDLYINDSFYESFRGSGILICTKTGSTGYCKSALGSIILPNVNAYELIELFPTLHAKKNTISSPIILNTNSSVNIKNIKSNYKNSLVADGIEEALITNDNSLLVSITKPKFDLFFTKNEKQYICKLQKVFIKG